MQERLIIAENGLPAAYAGDKPLHSRYNPRGEAEKYIRSLDLAPEIRFFILPEPGLGYIIAPLRQRFPRAKIIVLHLSDFFINPRPENEPGGQPAAVWSPGSGMGLQQFLEDEIPDTDAKTIKIIQWRPALAAYGEGYLRLLTETADFIKRADANKRTVRGFGLRWVRNFFRNLRLLRSVVTYPLLNRPLIVTGAGPSLEESIPLIGEIKKGGGLILAASSSVPALIAGGLAPDMVISTDGGGWALFHLYEGLRRGRGGKIPSFDLAAGLNAALPSQCGDLPLLPISDGSLWQDLVLRKLGVPFIALPQRGTVTASALDLAFSLTRGRVFIAGMDLSHRDIRTHARPYSFERFREEKASRLYPVYTQDFLRSRAMASGGSHDIYASWFSRRLAAYPGRLFSLGNNHPLFGDLKIREETDPDAGGKGAGRVFRKFWVNREDLAGRAAALLLDALNDEKTAAALTGELAPLVLPDEDDPGPAQLRQALAPILKACLPDRKGTEQPPRAAHG
ncbi:MAG: DUF115 domain-containing protein [Treponema sp.]|jgi:hypothetical protein|nr:DUF115 domain-containing protein [Treponema sp.]